MGNARARRLAGPLAGALGGIAFFVALFGLAPVDPTNLDWLWSGDLSQHVLGWMFFRNAPWQWPLGSIPDFIAPLGTTLAFTDSIPWLGVLAKVFSGVLPTPFQYEGLWLLGCFALQGAFGYLWVLELSGDRVLAWIASAFLISCPVLIHRTWHLTLCAQWMLLAGLFLFARASRAPEPRSTFGGWLALVVLSASTTPYLWVMCFALATVSLVATSLARPRARSAAALGLLALLTMTVVTWWCFGYLDGSHAELSGFGLYSMNLLSLVDSNGGSTFLPDLPSQRAQNEGFAYLGAGMLLLVPIAAAGALVGRERSRDPVLAASRPAARLLGALAVALALYALSDRVYAGSQQVLDLQSIYALAPGLSTAFRSSGRMVWIAYYCIYGLTLVTLWRAYSRNTACALALAALVLQLADAAPLYRHKADALTRDKPLARLAQADLPELRRDYRMVALLPPRLQNHACGEQEHGWNRYVPFAVLAARHGLAINSGYAARYPAADAATHCQQGKALLRGHRFREDTVYVIRHVELQQLPRDDNPLMCADLGPELMGYALCIARDSKTAFRERFFRPKENPGKLSPHASAP